MSPEGLTRDFLSVSCHFGSCRLSESCSLVAGFLQETDTLPENGSPACRGERLSNAGDVVTNGRTLERPLYVVNLARGAGLSRARAKFQNLSFMQFDGAEPSIGFTPKSHNGGVRAGIPADVSRRERYALTVCRQHVDAIARTAERLPGELEMIQPLEQHPAPLIGTAIEHVFSHESEKLYPKVSTEPPAIPTATCSHRAPYTSRKGCVTTIAGFLTSALPSRLGLSPWPFAGQPCDAPT